MTNKPVYLLEDLRRWFKEKWTAQDGSECGAYKGKGRVKCRPSKRVSGKTAQTWGEMSKKQKARAIHLKQRAHRKGHQFSSHKTGKTWKGGGKYHPKRVRSTVKESHVPSKPNKAEMKQIMSYLKGSINNPNRFYYLMLLSGMNGAKANSLLFDLKHPYLRTSNTLYRKRMLDLLKNIIDTITKDQLLYNRVRSMALSGNLSLHEQEGAATGGGDAGGQSGGMVGGTAETTIGMSTSTSEIPGVAPTPGPSTTVVGNRACQPPYGCVPPQKKKQLKRIQGLLRKQLYRRKP